MQHWLFSSVRPAFRVFLRSALGLFLLVAVASCEDDPIAEPATDSQPSGSYGGRLSQPAAGSNAALFPGHPHNPETY